MPQGDSIVYGKEATASTRTVAIKAKLVRAKRVKVAKGRVRGKVKCGRLLWSRGKELGKEKQ
jgi:hypothetical protein